MHTYVWEADLFGRNDELHGVGGRLEQGVVAPIRQGGPRGSAAAAAAGRRSGDEVESGEQVSPRSRRGRLRSRVGLDGGLQHMERFNDKILGFSFR